MADHLFSSVPPESFSDAPGRRVRPLPQGLHRPRRRLVSMTDVARVGDLQTLCLRRGYETESMSANIHAGDGLLDLWHMAVDAFTAGAAGLVMRVLLDRGGARTVGRIRSVAIEAENVGGFPQVGIVLRTVYVMATEASHA